MRTKSLIGLIFLMLIPVSTLANYDYNSKEFQAVVTQLDMQGHANDELSTCKVKQMYYEEVSEMLDDGMTVDEIIDSYVDEYGQAALREPASGKNGLLAWGMPIVGVVAGISVISIWLRKLRRRNNVELESQEISWDSELDKEITAKIFEEERRKQF